MNKKLARRVFTWLLAIAAMAFVAYVVPFRDRCEDPAVAGSTRVGVERDDRGCTLFVRSGSVRITTEECDQLRCEPGLLATFAHARIPIVAAMFLVYVGGCVAWATRWRLLLMLAGVRLPLLGVLRVSVQAQAAGILLPGGLGGDALRVAFIVGKGAPTSIVVASVLLDRVLGLVTLAAGAVVAALLSGEGSGASMKLVLVLAAIPLAFVLGLVLLRAPAIARLKVLQEGRIGKILGPVLTYVRDPKAPRAIVLGLIVSVVVSATQLVVVRGLVTALGGAPTEERWIYIGTAMAMIVSAIPALPGAWGTADAAYVFFFTPAGLSRATALAACLLYRLFWYVLGVIGALLQLGPRRETENRT